MGFSDICSLSFKAQERLDGSGIFNPDYAIEKVHS
jgi:hypothetical protein